jgi:hypothetical protein
LVAEFDNLVLSHGDRFGVISAENAKRLYTVNGVIPGPVAHRRVRRRDVAADHESTGTCCELSGIRAPWCGGAEALLLEGF